jgi:hypothetical protein
MDLGFDNQALLGASFDGAAAPGQLRAPDWKGLVARFQAAHALRRAMADSAARPDGGSFPDACASVLATNRESLSSVNPDALGNGKSLSAIAGIVAVAPNAATED